MATAKADAKAMQAYQEKLSGMRTLLSNENYANAVKSAIADYRTAEKGEDGKYMKVNGAFKYKLKLDETVLFKDFLKYHAKGLSEGEARKLYEALGGKDGLQGYELDRANNVFRDMKKQHVEGLDQAHEKANADWNAKFATKADGTLQPWAKTQKRETQSYIKEYDRLKAGKNAGLSDEVLFEGNKFRQDAFYHCYNFDKETEKTDRNWARAAWSGFKGLAKDVFGWNWGRTYEERFWEANEVKKAAFGVESMETRFKTFNRKDIIAAKEKYTRDDQAELKAANQRHEEYVRNQDNGETGVQIGTAVIAAPVAAAAAPVALGAAGVTATVTTTAVATGVIETALLTGADVTMNTVVSGKPHLSDGAASDNAWAGGVTAISKRFGLWGLVGSLFTYGAYQFGIAVVEEVKNEDERVRREQSQKKASASI